MCAPPTSSRQQHVALGAAEAPGRALRDGGAAVAVRGWVGVAQSEREVREHLRVQESFYSSRLRANIFTPWRGWGG